MATAPLDSAIRQLQDCRIEHDGVPGVLQFPSRQTVYTIRNMNATLRAALSQAQSWDLINRNAAIGIKLSTKKASKRIKLLTFPQIKALPIGSGTHMSHCSMRLAQSLAPRKHCSAIHPQTSRAKSTSNPFRKTRAKLWRG